MAVVLCTQLSFGQDSTATGSVMGRIDLPDPSSIENMYSYDPITYRYILSRILGDFNLSYPVVLTPQEYQ